MVDDGKTLIIQIGLTQKLVVEYIWHVVLVKSSFLIMDEHCFYLCRRTSFFGLYLHAYELRITEITQLGVMINGYIATFYMWTHDCHWLLFLVARKRL